MFLCSVSEHDKKILNYRLTHQSWEQQ